MELEKLEIQINRFNEAYKTLESWIEKEDLSLHIN